MSKILQADLEVRALRALYDFANQGASWTNAAAIAGLLQEGISAQRVEMALRTLTRAKFAHDQYVMGKAPAFKITEEGYKQVESDLQSASVNEFESAPASDRIVRFNDNSAEHIQAADLIIQITQAVESDNAIGVKERSRLKSALKAATEFWSALELKVIQIRVGILMALEDVRPWAKGKFYDALLAGAIALVKTFLNRIGLPL